MSSSSLKYKSQRAELRPLNVVASPNGSAVRTNVSNRDFEQKKKLFTLGHVRNTIKGSPKHEAQIKFIETLQSPTNSTGQISSNASIPRAYTFDSNMSPKQPTDDTGNNFDDISGIVKCQNAANHSSKISPRSRPEERMADHLARTRHNSDNKTHTNHGVKSKILAETKHSNLLATQAKYHGLHGDASKALYSSTIQSVGTTRRRTSSTYRYRASHHSAMSAMSNKQRETTQSPLHTRKYNLQNEKLLQRLLTSGILPSAPGVSNASSRRNRRRSSASKPEMQIKSITALQSKLSGHQTAKSFVRDYLKGLHNRRREIKAKQQAEWESFPQVSGSLEDAGGISSRGITPHNSLEAIKLPTYATMMHVSSDSSLRKNTGIAAMSSLLAHQAYNTPTSDDEYGIEMSGSDGEQMSINSDSDTKMSPDRFTASPGSLNGSWDGDRQAPESILAVTRLAGDLETRRRKKTAVPTNLPGTRILYGSIIALEAPTGGFLCIRKPPKTAIEVNAEASSNAHAPNRSSITGSVQTINADGTEGNDMKSVIHPSTSPTNRTRREYRYNETQSFTTADAPRPARHVPNQCTLFRVVNADWPGDEGRIKQGDHVMLEVVNHWMLGAKLTSSHKGQDPSQIYRSRVHNLLSAIQQYKTKLQTTVSTQEIPSFFEIVDSIEKDVFMNEGSYEENNDNSDMRSQVLRRFALAFFNSSLWPRPSDDIEGSTAVISALDELQKAIRLHLNQDSDSDVDDENKSHLYTERTSSEANIRAGRSEGAQRKESVDPTTHDLSIVQERAKQQLRQQLQSDVLNTNNSHGAVDDEPTAIWRPAAVACDGSATSQQRHTYVWNLRIHASAKAGHASQVASMRPKSGEDSDEHWLDSMLGANNILGNGAFVSLHQDMGHLLVDDVLGLQTRIGAEPNSATVKEKQAYDALQSEVDGLLEAAHYATLRKVLYGDDDDEIVANDNSDTFMTELNDQHNDNEQYISTSDGAPLDMNAGGGYASSSGLKQRHIATEAFASSAVAIADTKDMDNSNMKLVGGAKAVLGKSKPLSQKILDIFSNALANNDIRPSRAVSNKRRSSIQQDTTSDKQRSMNQRRVHVADDSDDNNSSHGKNSHPLKSLSNIASGRPRVATLTGDASHEAIAGASSLALGMTGRDHLFAQPRVGMRGLWRVHLCSTTSGSKQINHSSNPSKVSSARYSDQSPDTTSRMTGRTGVNAKSKPTKRTQLPNSDTMSSRGIRNAVLAASLSTNETAAFALLMNVATLQVDQIRLPKWASRVVKLLKDYPELRHRLAERIPIDTQNTLHARLQAAKQRAVMRLEAQIPNVHQLKAFDQLLKRNSVVPESGWNNLLTTQQTDANDDIVHLLDRARTRSRANRRLLEAEVNHKLTQLDSHVSVAVWSRMQRPDVHVKLTHMISGTRVEAAVVAIQRAFRDKIRHKWPRQFQRLDVSVIHQISTEDEAFQNENQRWGRLGKIRRAVSVMDQVKAAQDSSSLHTHETPTAQAIWEKEKLHFRTPRRVKSLTNLGRSKEALVARRRLLSPISREENHDVSVSSASVPKFPVDCSTLNDPARHFSGETFDSSPMHLKEREVVTKCFTPNLSRPTHIPGVYVRQTASESTEGRSSERLRQGKKDTYPVESALSGRLAASAIDIVAEEDAKRSARSARSDRRRRLSAGQQSLSSIQQRHRERLDTLATSASTLEYMRDSRPIRPLPPGSVSVSLMRAQSHQRPVSACVPRPHIKKKHGSEDSDSDTSSDSSTASVLSSPEPFSLQQFWNAFGTEGIEDQNGGQKSHNTMHDFGSHNREDARKWRLRGNPHFLKLSMPHSPFSGNVDKQLSTDQTSTAEVFRYSPRTLVSRRRAHAFGVADLKGISVAEAGVRQGTDKMQRAFSFAELAQVQSPVRSILSSLERNYSASLKEASEARQSIYNSPTPKDRNPKTLQNSLALISSALQAK